MTTSFNHTLNWVRVPKAESLVVRICRQVCDSRQYNQ